MERWSRSGGRWFWLYAVLVVAVWLVVVVLLDGPLLWGTIYALFQVEVAFRVVEWARRRRQTGPQADT